MIVTLAIFGLAIFVLVYFQFQSSKKLNSFKNDIDALTEDIKNKFKIANNDLDNLKHTTGKIKIEGDEAQLYTPDSKVKLAEYKVTK